MLHIGKIEKIIANNTKNNYFTATLTWLDMPGGFYNEASISAQVKLSYAHISRSFGFQYYPVPGDIVVCAFLEDGHPIVLSFLSADYYNKVIDNNNYGYYFRNIVQGEYALKGFKGNEIYIDRVGSLRFITRDQNIVTDVLATYEANRTKKLTDKEKLEQKNYIRKFNTDNFLVNLETQVENYPKTEVTIGKVYDDKYKEEQLLNDEEISVQIVGKRNTATKENGKVKVDTEETYKIQINTEGEISLGRTDGTYNIIIDKEGNIILTGKSINLEAKKIILDGEPGVKGTTLQNWCNSHTHSNGNNGSPTGPSLLPLPQTTLANIEE